MGRVKTGRDISTLLRLSKEGRKALLSLCKTSGISSRNAYADKLFQKLWEKGTPIVTSSRSKDPNDKS
jgi:hypothetical protein